MSKTGHKYYVITSTVFTSTCFQTKTTNRREINERQQSLPLELKFNSSKSSLLKDGDNANGYDTVTSRLI